MNKETLTRVGLSLAAFAAGYMTASLVMRAKYEAILSQEIESVKDTFARAAEPKEEDAVIEDAAPYFSDSKNVPDADVSSLVVGMKYGDDEPPQRVNYSKADIELEDAVDDEEEAGLLFTQSDGDEEGAYLISHTEFIETHDDWDKITLSYFMEDDTLVDDQEIIVPDVNFVIGEKALQYFGKRSGDPNIVYIRNPEIETDFEVLFDRRSIAQALYGLEDEARPVNKKVRVSDDE